MALLKKFSFWEGIFSICLAICKFVAALYCSEVLRVLISRFSVFLAHYNNRQEITVKLINRVSLLNCCWAEFRVVLICVIMLKDLVNHGINTSLMETFGINRKLWLGPGQA